ncbi:MAG: amidohydrolase family protein [Xanthomonadales bacterium]|nr:amidohydrolase family protein [Xanthomonadales bacterium]
MSTLLLRRALLQPQGQTIDVRIAHGRYQAIGEQLTIGADDTVIDAEGQWLMPGLVDPLTRLREPGQTHKTTIAREARAALARGITWLGMAPDTQPPIDSRAVLELVDNRARAAGGAGVRAICSLTREQGLAELAGLQSAGAPLAADVGSPIQDAGLLRRALLYAASVSMPVLLQPIDLSLQGDGAAHDGPVAARLGLAGIPSSSETVAVARIVLLAEESGAEVLIGPLSCADSLPLIAQAQARGVRVSAMVSTLQLSLNELDLYPFRSFLHLQPPLRSEADRAALLQAVRQGLVSVLCSDHQPHDVDAQLAPFPETAVGASTLDAHLGLGLRLVQRGELALADLIERACLTPRRWLGLPAYEFSEGAPADCILVDPHRDLAMTPANLLSGGRNSPFLGWRLPGQVRLAVRGAQCWQPEIYE